MKTRFVFPSICLVLTSLAASASANQQETAPAVPAAPTTSVTRETTRTAVLPDPALSVMKGKIDRMDAEKKQLLLRTKNGKAPIPYNCNAATKFIDLDGKPVDTALLKPETPVDVNFVEDGNEMIASTVIVQRIQTPLPGGGMTLTTRETLKPGGKVIEESVKTTLVTTSGMVSKFEPGFITVKSEGDVNARRYQYSDTTAWVDTLGKPVPASVMKSGFPVKVSYTRQGEAYVADQVVVTLPEVDSPPSNEIKDTTPKEP